MIEYILLCTHVYIIKFTIFFQTIFQTIVVIHCLTTVIQLQGLQWPACKLSCTLTPGKMSLFNCGIYPLWRVSRVTDMELILFVAHLIQQPGSILGIGWDRCNQTTNVFLSYQFLPHFKKKNLCMCTKKFLIFNIYILFIFKETSWISII